MLNRKIVVKVAEKNRATISLQAVRELEAQPGDYLKVRAAKNEKECMFYVQVPQVPPSRKYLQVRRSIPEAIAKELGIKPGDEVELTLLELVRREKPTEIFTEGKIDLLAASPEYSHSGRPLMVDVFMRDGDEWMRVWYSAGQGNKPKEIEIKRYLPLNRASGEFFGLLQAEGRKSGSRFDFTNTLVEEHARLVNFVNDIVKGAEWSMDVFYNAGLTDKVARQKLQYFLKTVKISPRRVSFIKHQTVSDCAFTVRINSTVLGEMLMAALRMIRSKAAELARDGKLERGLREFCKGFALKDLLGDGSVALQLIRGRRKSRGMIITLNEVNEMFQADIISILSGLGLRTTPCSKNKTSRIGLRKNLQTYIWILKNGAFVEHFRNRGKFLASFYDNHYTKKLLRLSGFRGKAMTTQQFAKITRISTDAAHMYLSRHVKKGHLYLLGGKNRRENKYGLTREGELLVKALERGLEELHNIMTKYGAKDTNELLQKVVKSRSHANPLQPPSALTLPLSEQSLPCGIPHRHGQYPYNFENIPPQSPKPSPRGR